MNKAKMQPPMLFVTIHNLYENHLKFVPKISLDFPVQILYDRAVMTNQTGVMTPHTERGVSLTLQEFYTAVGGDYNEAVNRMMGEAMLRRFLQKFPNDPSFDHLEEALFNKNREEAFRAAHTIKGLCLNLGFGTLFKSSEVLTEALRHEMPANAAELFEQVKTDYVLTMDALTQL